MPEGKRDRRRRDIRRVKLRMRRRALLHRMGDEWITPAFVGRSAAVHGTCHALMCRNPRRFDGSSSFADRRRMPIEDAE